MSQKLAEELKNRFKDKKILVVGLGLQGGGLGLVRFFSDLGAKVNVTDLKTDAQLAQSLDQLEKSTIKYSLGAHKLGDFLESDYIFKGPSVPWNLPELVEAEKKGIPIEMEVSFFASLSPALIIGITGTRGKTTTAQIIFDSLKDTSRRVFLAGNVADTSTISLLNNVTKNDLVVLELSSWQLSGFHRKKISPHIAVFMNFYPDHLNYYRNEEEYFYDKSAIYAYQKPDDCLLANSALEEKLSKEKIASKISYFSSKDFPAKLTNMRGEHNYENAAAALLVNRILGNKDQSVINKISQSKGVYFRQEIIKTEGKLVFVNDSTSTTPTSLIKALETFTDGEVVLILGGDSKNLPFDKLLDKLNIVNSLILLKGTFTDEIYKTIKERFSEKIAAEPYDNLNLALNKAYEIAKNLKKKTYILFSPGSTSFSMFENEFDRGRKFNQLVQTL